MSLLPCLLPSCLGQGFYLLLLKDSVTLSLGFVVLGKTLRTA